MPTIKHAKAAAVAADTKHFSLVPADAQQQMYKTLLELKPVKPGTTSGAEIAEIAVCHAIGKQDPVILAYPARGACLARKESTSVATNGLRLQKATILAVTAMLSDMTATAVVCAGQFGPKENYRDVLSFAARHKLPILFVVSSSFTPGQKSASDLRTLYPEYGIPVFSVDANDAIAAYRVATEALHNARYHRGPCIIEALLVNSAGVSKGAALDLLQSYMERHGNWPV